jgi:hypothetical protein
MIAPTGFVSVPSPQRTELVLEALKVALATPGEHRLFRAGRLTGLFPARGGVAAEAATLAVRGGLLETTRTEVKGKLVTEWVRATHSAVEFVHQNDSTRSILRELRDVLQLTQTGVPEWMAEAKAELVALSASFEARATAVLNRLADLTRRCETALRRAETAAPLVSSRVAQLVPWAMEALEYLDKRAGAGATGDCPLPELFHLLREKFPGLTMVDFHDGVKRLHDVRVLRLSPATELTEPEFAVVADGQLMFAVGR